jgi:hypothetical protein
MREIRKFACSVFILAILSLSVCFVSAENENSIWGSLYKAIPLHPQNDFTAKEDVLHRWNRIAVGASGLDHTPVRAGENRVFGEQIGPGRTSRAMAIVHITIFDAIN